MYLLLLGLHYGTVFPETGRSPTHEEYTAALAEGIPRLVFRKAGVEFDASQMSFIDEIEAYDTGVFRESFTDAVDLQAKVAQALNNVPPGPLVWYPLREPVHVSWRSTWSSSTLRTPSRTEVCVHAIPVEPARRSRRELRELSDAIATRLRALGIVAPSEAIDLYADEACATATIRESSVLRAGERWIVAVWSDAASTQMDNARFGIGCPSTPWEPSSTSSISLNGSRSSFE